MSEFTISLKNYRCFADTSPLSIEVGKVFTALICPNNSGKSSFLKFFYELRNLFGYIQPIGNFLELAYGGTQQVNFQEVYDQQEVFSDSNERPMTVELKVSVDAKRTASAPRLDTVKWSCARSNAWSAEFGYSPRGSLSHPLGRGQYSIKEDGMIRSQGAAVAADCEETFTLSRQLSNGMYIGKLTRK